MSRSHVFFFMVFMACCLLVTGVLTLRGHHQARAGTSNQMVLDANVALLGIQQSQSAELSTSFPIGIHITDYNGDYYEGYDWVIEFRSPELAFSGAVENTAATGLALCPPPTQVTVNPNPPIPAGHVRYASGCTTDTSAPPATYKGQITTITMSCGTTPGIYSVHLVPDPSWGTNSHIYSAGTPQDTSTGDITITCGPTPTPTPTNTPTRTPTPSPTPTPAPNVMAVDANGTTAGVLTARSVPTQTSFQIGVWITSVTAPYDGFQWEIAFPIGTFDYQGTVNSPPVNFGCVSVMQRLAVPNPASVAYYGGCLSAGDSSYTGQVAKITLKCNAVGPFTIHLVTYAEDPGSGSTLFVNGASPAPTLTQDAVINCALP